eukprot:CAMPEP_0174372258 /NCGR_PEP_ID=MMETSP0811_2-20130205/102928_1 /TAXON_ID=73025 ORGANISM="Eutreptiella gymnastica-like, Strain CCMP1594" /NCGR_SAMPLE_ID=MMETSP0811_2 /ASSEMBLY_ACC=CAM_ASM_000667 /LENGTH=74 /DNA_ID=CAMNT_0015519485 /DNA_START=555 /DNA_END=776 /DNA_ORIENTATION=+
MTFRTSKSKANSKMKQNNNAETWGTLGRPPPKKKRCPNPVDDHNMHLRAQEFCMLATIPLQSPALIRLFLTLLL